MKLWKFGVGLLLVVAAFGGGAVLTTRLGTIGKITEHEVRIDRTEKNVAVLESRTTTVEQRVDDHEKRIQELERERQEALAELARLKEDLARTRAALEEGEKRLKIAEDKLAQGDKDARALADEVSKLRAALEADRLARDRLEKDVLKRLEVLEKLNDAKLQR